MRVGALPQFPTNELKYNLTWSTDGLINEYCNPCEAIHDGKSIDVLPLEGLEHFSLDGVDYEAFNTSGGLGTLCETLEGQVRELNYKTVRYPGHRDLMAFLMNELRLSERRELLKDILENARADDVSGRRGHLLHRHRLAATGSSCRYTDARKIYHQTIARRDRGAPSKSRPPPASAPRSTCTSPASCRRGLRAAGADRLSRLHGQSLWPQL